MESVTTASFGGTERLDRKVIVAKRPKPTSLGPFAVNLKKILEERNITAKAAAQLAQIPNSTLGHWLSGVIPQDLEAVHRLAVALDVDFQFLLLGKRSPVKHHSVEELFEIADEATMSGLFQIEIKRLKPKKSEGDNS